MKRRVTEYALYRYRYVIGYSLALLTIIGILIVSALYVPGGLRAEEKHTTLLSGSLAFQQFDPQSVINLPYHLFQRVFMAIFGVGELTLKLPSLLLGLAAVAGMFLLIKEWFRHNVAVITVLLTATLPAFIFIAQDATPQIYPIAISIWLLLIGTLVSRRREPHMLWKVLFFTLLALNMYAPLGIYLNIAIISTIIFHPHIRYQARKLNPNRIFIGIAVALLVLTPLLYSLATHWELGFELLGIPQQLPNFADNARQLGQAFVWQDGTTNGVFHPIMSLGVLAIMIIGFIRFLKVKYTARSYIIWLWGVMLLPLLLLNPDLAVYIIPMMLLMIAMGINTLIAEWYRIFPHNPYARILGLIPLSVIVAGVAISGISRYTLNYHYNPEVVHGFTSDVRLLKDVVKRSGATSEAPINVVVGKKDREFYQLFANYDRRFVVSDDPQSVPLPFIRSGDTPQSADHVSRQPSYISVNARSQDGARFYLYTEPRK